MDEGVARPRVADRPGVVLVHWAFPPTTGGVESHLADAARLLSDLGIRVTVVTGEEAPIAGGAYNVISTPLLQLDRIREFDRRHRDYRTALESLFAGVIEEGGFEVVHGHNLQHFTPEPALALDALRGRLHLDLHHTFHGLPQRRSGKVVFRGWSGNYAVSSWLQEACRKRLGFRPSLARLGVDVERFRCIRNAFEGREVPTILHPARLLPWKGVLVSVRMLGELARRGVRARLIITDTQRIADSNPEVAEYRRDVVELTSSLGLDRWVEFRPASFEEMPALYDSTDVVVYPTVGNEPFGLVPLEAMSSGRPVVASRSGGIPETIVDGSTGFLVEPNDVNALTDRVARLISDHGLGRRMGTNGRQRVARLFDIRRYVAWLAERYGFGAQGPEAGLEGVPH